MAGPHGILFKNTVAQPTSLDIDLNQYSAGYTGTVTFGVANPLNGVVTLLADGHTAHFVPTANFSGLAGYSFSVTDGVSIMIKSVSVLVSSTPPPVDVVWHGDGTASVQIDGGGALSGVGTINGSLTNQGTAIINGNGTLTVNGNFENDGTQFDRRRRVL